MLWCRLFVVVAKLGVSQFPQQLHLRQPRIQERLNLIDTRGGDVGRGDHAAFQRNIGHRTRARGHQRVLESALQLLQGQQFRIA